MTPEQRAINKVRRYFSKPGARLSKSPSGMCYYRYPDQDCRCGIGALIPNRLYKPKFEGNGITVLIGDYPEIAEHFAGLSTRFLRKLQGAHDLAQNVDHFLRKLDELEKQYA